jgi:hypothetical protein
MRIPWDANKMIWAMGKKCWFLMVSGGRKEWQTTGWSEVPIGTYTMRYYE